MTAPARRARVVCTLGPASASPEIIGRLVAEGMDVARLNLSHGTHPDHAALHARVRQASQAAGRPVATLADLQGPKIRLGRFAGGSAALLPGASFTLVTGGIVGDAARAAVSEPSLPDHLRPGDAVLLDDGRIRLQVVASGGGEARCTVLEGGTVSDHKGVNVPGARLRLPALTEKDRADLRFALELGVDWVAMSFVRQAGDADAARACMRERGAEAPLIAKLETPQAVAELERILPAFDALMVARGDLGVEMPLERIPHVQKRAIRLARAHRKPVIVATQMLESMVRDPRPTRAEVSDVANAVLDGADALMLSAETSAGLHPEEAVRTMVRVIEIAETEGGPLPPLEASPTGRPDAVAAAALQLAGQLSARAVAAFTRSGGTACSLAALRGPTPLFAFTPETAVCRRLQLVWGVESFAVPEPPTTDEMVRQVDRALMRSGRVRPGDEVVIVSGSPPGVPGTANMVRAHRVGEEG